MAVTVCDQPHDTQHFTSYSAVNPTILYTRVPLQSRSRCNRERFVTNMSALLSLSFCVFNTTLKLTEQNTFSDFLPRQTDREKEQALREGEKHGEVFREIRVIRDVCFSLRLFDTHSDLKMHQILTLRMFKVRERKRERDFTHLWLTHKSLLT